MNYFELYELPITFTPDLAQVKQKFYALSKQYHPDFYINESVEKQQEVLELSTQNNKAYNVLRDQQKRVKYILQLNNLLPEGENYPLPQEFLMEMMEVNEALMELDFEPNPAGAAKVKEEILVIEKDMAEELAALISDFETLAITTQKEQLLKIKDHYYRNKYLSRLKESLAKQSFSN